MKLKIANLRVVEKEWFRKVWEKRQTTKKDIYTYIEDKQNADYIYRIFSLYGWVNKNG